MASQAEGLQEEPYDSPRVKLWKQKARDLLETEFGPDYVEILNRTLFFNRVIRGRAEGQAMHRKAMADAATLLTELQSELPSPAAVAESPGDGPLLQFDSLHVKIVTGCKALYDAGSYAEAVEKSFKVVRGRLRSLTGFETGSDAFGTGRLRISGAAARWVEDDFNEAVKFLTMAIDRFRNEKAHTVDGNITEPVRAAEYLAMSSLAMHLLDGAYIEGAAPGRS